MAIQYLLLQINTFVGVEYSASVADFFNPTNLRPVAAWHPHIQNVVYWGEKSFQLYTAASVAQSSLQMLSHRSLVSFLGWECNLEGVHYFKKIDKGGGQKWNVDDFGGQCTMRLALHSSY